MRLLFWLLLMSWLTLTGCASSPKVEFSENSINDTIAMNFVYVISQVPSLHPDRNTFQTDSPVSEFELAFVRRLADAGYAIKRTEKPGALRTYSYSTDYGEQGVYHVTVDIDHYRFTRSYHTRSGVADPITPFVIQGTHNTKVKYKINDYVFPRRVSSPISRVAVSVPVAPNRNLTSLNDRGKFTSQWFYSDIQNAVGNNGNASILSR